MHHSPIWEDINLAVHHAINDRLHLLDEGDLIERSDAILATVPIVGGQQPTTALLLRRYESDLRQELCVEGHPRSTFETLEDQLRELTRAVMVAIDSAEGISVDSAVLLALVVRLRGVEPLCGGSSR